MLKSPPLRVDLHCHSDCSDGALPPVAVVERAHGNGVQVLALTDHDQIAGVAPAAARAGELGVRLIHGVEVSTQWQHGGALWDIHIIGLNFRLDDAHLLHLLAQNASGRELRAQRMAEDLAGLGIANLYARALEFAGGRVDLLSRTHFARVLVEAGRASHIRAVFADYMVPGKIGYVPHAWADMRVAVAAIVAAGGVAVLAHPGHYRLSGEQEAQIVQEFMAAGGQGIEVIAGGHKKSHIQHYAKLCRSHGLYASAGSDFHAPKESQVDVGCAAPLPKTVRSVMELCA